MVISKSGKRPHLVTPKKNGSMTCDSDCPHYKSAGICSHVVATAISTNRLSQFIAAVTKVKRTPSLHMLAVTDMPKGRGRKGGKPPAKRKCSTPIDTRVPMSVHQSQSPASSCLVNAPIINSYNCPNALMVFLGLLTTPMCLLHHRIKSLQGALHCWKHQCL